jgi:hypothetical protein
MDEVPVHRLPDVPEEQPFLTIDDVFAFIESAAKPLIGATIVGALVAGSFSFLQRQVTAEVVVANQSASPITFTLWAQLRQALPALAGAIDDARRSEGKESERTPWLVSPAWWTSSVEPVLALSRDDARMLANGGEDLKGASTQIMTFRVRHSDSTIDRALRGAEASAAFMRSGSLYLELKSLLNSYQAESLTQASQKVTAELLKTDGEIAFSRIRVQQIESLLKRGGSVGPSPQLIVDVGEQAQAKYLPLSTQLNAVQLEIAQLEEQKARFVNLQNRGRLLAEFQARAHEALAAVAPGDGVAAADALIQAADDLNESVDGRTPEVRLAQTETIARILYDVTALRTRYVVELPEVSRSYRPPSLRRSLMMIGAGAVGAAAAMVVMLLLWGQYRSYRNHAGR